MRAFALSALLIGAATASQALAEEGDSVCYGTSSKGHLVGGVQIPAAGPNFGPYSSLGVLLGRTFVQAKVASTIKAAYAELAKSAPDKKYVYGESGWRSGGRIRPHRTHQNGTAVDFMVPVVDEAGRSVPLPTGLTNKFGYAIEFDGKAQYDGLTIDFEAIAQHLFALYQAAQANGIGISRVIFERAYIPSLYTTSRGDFVKSTIPFMQGEPWIRHDEHYHVDFAVACKKEGS